MRVVADDAVVVGVVVVVGDVVVVPVLVVVGTLQITNKHILQTLPAGFG